MLSHLLRGHAHGVCVCVCAIFTRETTSAECYLLPWSIWNQLYEIIFHPQLLKNCSRHILEITQAMFRNLFWKSLVYVKIWLKNVFSWALHEINWANLWSRTVHEHWTSFQEQFLNYSSKDTEEQLFVNNVLEYSKKKKEQCWPRTVLKYS